MHRRDWIDCKYLARGDHCYAGCTPEELARHWYYMSGHCKYGDRCNKSHFPNTRSRSPRRARDPEPYAGAQEDLTLLGLNKDRENVSRGLIREARKQRIFETHPDKHYNDGQERHWTELCKKVAAAVERLLECPAFPDRCG